MMRGRATGTWIVGGMVALAVVLAIVAIWYQREQTRRCLGFYGSEAAHRIQAAPRVELWRPGPGGVAVRPESVRRIDVSRARGRVHMRRGLVEDANFDWGPSPPPTRPAPAVVLAFFDGADDTDPQTALIVRLDERGGWLEVAGRPGVLVPGRIAAGLKVWLDEVVTAGPDPVDPR